MPSDTATLAPAPAAPAEAGGIRGAVDNVGREKIYGWAWNPNRPEERLRIEVRLGTEVALTGRADFARPDLPGAGIGDGNHAFEIKLTPECLARSAELSVFAIDSTGAEAPLRFRVRRTPEVAAAEAKRSIEMLAAGQRELREEMRAAIAGLSRGGRGEGGAAQVASVQARIEERLGTLDLWLTRLDARLAALAEAQPAAAPPRRFDVWQLVLGTVLGLSAGGALAVTLLLLG